MDQSSRSAKPANSVLKWSQNVPHPLTVFGSPSKKRKSPRNNTYTSPFALPPTIKWSQYEASKKPSELAEEEASCAGISYTIRNLWAPAILPIEPSPLPVPITPNNKLLKTPENPSKDTPAVFTHTLTKSLSRYDGTGRDLDSNAHTPTKKRANLRDSDSINLTLVTDKHQRTQAFVDKQSNSPPQKAAVDESYSPTRSPTEKTKSKRKRTGSFTAPKQTPVKRRRSNSQRGWDGERKSARQEGVLKKIDEKESQRHEEEILAKTPVQEPTKKPRMTADDLRQATAKWTGLQKHFDTVNFMEPLHASKRAMDEMFQLGRV